MAKTCHPAGGRSRHYVKRAGWHGYVFVERVKVHTSVTDYFLKLPNFLSLSHPSSKCFLPAKGHGPMYMVSTHDHKFVWWYQRPLTFPQPRICSAPCDAASTGIFSFCFYHLQNVKRKKKGVCVEMLRNGNLVKLEQSYLHK